MKAKVRAALEEALKVPIREAVRIRKFARTWCKCGDLVGCRICRVRRQQTNKRRTTIGMRPLPLPPPPQRVLSCKCGDCDKCHHRLYMRQWRKLKRETGRGKN